MTHPALLFFNYLCLLGVQDPCCGLLHVINFKIFSVLTRPRPCGIPARKTEMAH